MKKIKIILISIILFSFTNVDIAPNPIAAKGIYPYKECKIRMESETVMVDLSVDQSIVKCTFEMKNYGSETILDVGFPVMEFQYWAINGYQENDKSNFKICVDGKDLSENEIKAPIEADSLYKEYMKVYAIEKELSRKTDSVYNIYGVTKKKNGTLKFSKKTNATKMQEAISELYKWRNKQPYVSGDLVLAFDEQIGQGKYPWYVWNLKFKENEHKTITVSYKLPAGLSYGAEYRYFKYILNTGAGWYGDIGQADIILKLDKIDLGKVEKISPSGYSIDKKKNIIKWNFKNIEPTLNDDIYLQYFVRKEREAFNKRFKK
ncbi:hypothetical protein FCR2A7T_27400 [Flavobacterium cauense R2A-7]|uniref:DUF4424 domain-containing protein n=1 Tax=Flavobacterium cauense R2A-7 TaxID=1341154 RepID=V6RWU9_9FLAO|nr:hypothetical protein [Flavobacterium cauense]ESU18634.1 hypothetical protein FCR2A7T_27400 [Flavobacterium cauense R2A-7]KGO78688.1 hypothetical protein Q762_15020 [Flavobacterium cauense R2A-7]TWI07279.1 hypothetical protein IP98_02977 [Flavobacterium cauense R2A-7]